MPSDEPRPGRAGPDRGPAPGPHRDSELFGLVLPPAEVAALRHRAALVLAPGRADGQLQRHLAGLPFHVRLRLLLLRAALRAGWGPAHLAVRSGLDEGHVRRLLEGQALPSLADAAALAAALGVPLDAFSDPPERRGHRPADPARLPRP